MIETRYCDDCKTEHLRLFTVHDSLWLSVCEKKEILCLVCFEKRLNRRVTLYDLKPSAITQDMFLGAYVGFATANLPPDNVLLNAELFVERKWKGAWEGSKFLFDKEN